jgi:hypothetical protein
MAKGNRTNHNIGPMIAASTEKNTKHGLYRWQQRAVSEWPVEMQTAYLQRYEEIISHEHIDQIAHKGAVAQPSVPIIVRQKVNVNERAVGGHRDGRSSCQAIRC